MRKKSTQRKQKMYNMKGCSYTKKRRNKKRNMKGGCGGTCSAGNHSMIGGYIRKHSNTNNKKRKIKDTSSDSRHSHSRTPSSQMGGGLTIIPQDVTNFFRTISDTGGSIYNTASGYNPPVSQAPYADQYKSYFSKF